jgi:DHA2 family lincomycin resistance protein-like MFS transporter
MTAPLDTGELAVPAPPRTDSPENGPTGRTPLVVKLLVLSAFVVILNETIMINAVPRLMADFKIDQRTSQWITSVFMLTMAAVIPVTGWLLQRVTTRTAYAIAMIAFCSGTLIGALAPTFGVLLGARVVQAAGTAVMMPLLMTTLMRVVPESDRGRVMGSVTLAMSCAPALGPTVSGLLLGFGSWRLIFVTVLPIALVVGIAGFRLMPNIGEPQRVPVSWFSVALAAVGFGTLVYGLSQIGKGQPLEADLLIAGGVVLVAIFAGYQLFLQRSGSPLLDLRTLNHRTYAVALLLMAAAFMAFLGAMFLLPQYLQGVRGLSPLRTGLMVMPGGLVMGLLGPRVGKLYDRLGSRPLVIPGAIGMVVALVVLSRIAIDTPYWQLVATHVLLMACLAMIFTPVFTLGLGALPPQLYSHGSSLLGTLQQVSGAIGTALLVVIMTNRSASLIAGGASKAEAFVGGLQWAFVTGAVMGVAVIVCSLFLPARVEAPEGAPAHH